MTRKRYKKQQIGSFFGEWTFDRVVPEDHFLRQLEAMVPWGRFTDQLLPFYARGAVYGQPPYDPAVMSRCCWSPICTTRRNVQQNSRSMIVLQKWFLRLAVDEPAPHHSTLTKFRQRLLRNGNGEALEQMLDAIIHRAQETGVGLGTLHVIDSVHSIADGLLRLPSNSN